MTLAFLGRFPVLNLGFREISFCGYEGRPTECAVMARQPSPSLVACRPPRYSAHALPPSAGSYLANSPANRGGLPLLIFLDSTSRFEQADLALRFPISEAVIRSFCVVLVFGKQESRLRHVLGLLIIRTKSGYNGNTHLLVVFSLPSAPLTSQLRGIERRPRAPRSIFTRLPSVPLVSAQCPILLPLLSPYRRYGS